MKVNEIFYSIQGEGFHTGTAAVFIRLSGCNLKCPFCDTDFSKYEEKTEQQIVDIILAIGGDSQLVVITGGEPTLQNCTMLIDMLHRHGKIVAMESNGTREVPYNIDWLTISPKQQFVGKAGFLEVRRCNELKVVYDGTNDPELFSVNADHYYIQPCDKGFIKENQEIRNKCVEYIKEHPKWKLSLQTQKILKVR